MPTKLPRVSHRDVTKAVERYNAIRGLSYPSIGYLQYADIRGDGSYRPNLYVQVNEGGGVASSYTPKKGKTLRETLANVEEAVRLYSMFDKCEGYVLIINATHERGIRQYLSLAEMRRRGLYLSEVQKRQAGLIA